MNAPIYMDSHATTPVDPRVLDAMLPYFSTHFGNPSSRSHAYGWQAEEAVERARGQIARAVGAHRREIVFTSGATEANNLVLKGLADAAALAGHPPPHVVTLPTEHKSLLDVAQTLAKQGRIRLSLVPVPPSGRIRPEDIEPHLEADTALVSVMAANNEIGVIQPLADIGRLLRPLGILFHCDATQALGKVPFDVAEAQVDLASFSAHKLYGPKGVGALYCRRRRPRIRLAPLLEGGGQERGLRAGTLNVPAIVGFGAAAELALRLRDEEATRLTALRDRLWQGLQNELDEIRLNGTLQHRLPHNLNVSFRYVEGESLLVSLPDIALSSGSACTSATIAPSHVLKALGLSDDLAIAALRFGLHRWTSEDEVEQVIARVSETVRALRRSSPHWAIAQRQAAPETHSTTTHLGTP